jgi:hypothetical protein
MFELKFVLAIKPGWARGVITIADYKETFECNTDYWSEDDYVASWGRSAVRLLETSNARFLTSVGPPTLSDFYWTWPAWLEGELVFVQNQMLLADSIRTMNSADEAENLTSAREEFDDEGNAISTWLCRKSDVVAFVRDLAK